MKKELEELKNLVEKHEKRIDELEKKLADKTNEAN